jgi:hypothetical protein
MRRNSIPIPQDEEPQSLRIFERLFFLVVPLSTVILGSVSSKLDDSKVTTAPVEDPMSTLHESEANVSALDDAKKEEMIDCALQDLVI